MTRAGLLAFLVAALAAPGCGSRESDAEVPAYQHNRWDYWSFRARVGSLPEPSYLPWAMHVETLPEDGLALVACRWPDSAFPLRFFVLPPAIPEGLASEWSRRRPEDYEQAVEEAFAAWEKAVGRPVRFRRVGAKEEADVEIQLRAEVQAAEVGQVLGVVRGEEGRCRVTGPGSTHDGVEIAFAPRMATLYVADDVGLLTPRQVRAVALHEIGHLLGISGQHSPLAGDVMFQIAEDRRIPALSDHDKNTLAALYRVPPGAIYARLAERHEPPLSEVRRGPPKLAVPTEDERNGFSVRFPKDWQVIKTPHGWIAVDGVSWDYDASLQVVAARGDAAAHLALLADQGAARGDDVRSETFELDGAPVVRLQTRGSERSEQTEVLPWRDGFSLIVLADARTRDIAFYQPWFQRVLFSIEPLDGSAAAEGAPREDGDGDAGGDQ
jgi:predicted Zn-dependent protease